MLSFFHNKVTYIFTFCVLLFICISLPVAVFGQQGNNAGVSMLTVDTAFEVKNKELKDVVVAIKNDNNIPFDGTIGFTSGELAKIVTKDKLPVHIDAKSISYFSVKVYINSNSTEGNIPVYAQLTDSKGVQLQELQMKLHLASSKLMVATILQSEIIMPRVGEMLRIPVMISNKGNVAQDATVVVSFPVSLQDKTNKSIKFPIAPFTDTTIVFERKVTRAMMKLGYMNISMFGIYPDGNYFSVHSVSIQNLKSKKTYSESNDLPSKQGHNYISAGVQNAFTANESYFVRGRGDYAIKDGNVSFSVNANKWKAAGVPTLINDTWLGMEYKHVGVKVGNIVQSGELSFNGRGIEAYYYLDSMHKSRIYTGYIDKSFNLINSGGNQSYGRASWLGFQHDKGNVFNNTSISYDQDNYQKSKSVLLVDNLRWKISDALYTEVKAGLARSNTSLTTSQNYNSFTTGWSFGGNLSKSLSVSSENIYASAYYPGSRRGTFSLIEKMNWRFKESNAYIGLIHTNVQPKYFSTSTLLFQSNNTSTTAEIGYGRNIGLVSMSIAPQLYTESGNWFTGNNNLDGTMHSLRLATSFSYTTVSNRNNFLLKTDIGGYTTGFNSDKRLQFRSNLTYSYGVFRFSGNVQQGNFYLAEAFQDYLGRQNSLRMNLGPTVSMNFFNRKLKWDAGITYYKDFYVKSFLYNTALNFTAGSTLIFANAQYNAFSNSRAYHNIQFGITQYLPQRDKISIENKGKIDLFIYYDVNGNGNYDKGVDSVAVGYMANISRSLLISDNGGNISYRKLPPGNYPVYFPTQKGWYGLDLFVPLGAKEQKSFEIALKQTGAIHGTLKFEVGESSLSYDVNKEISGLTIKAMSEEGKAYETKTDDAGQYNLYLPTGVYTITIDELSQQIEVIATGNNVQPVKIGSGQNLNDFNFTLKPKQRKIEIKKFGQKK